MVEAMRSKRRRAVLLPGRPQPRVLLRCSVGYGSPIARSPPFVVECFVLITEERDRAWFAVTLVVAVAVRRTGDALPAMVKKFDGTQRVSHAI